jgi:hypothetical protein
MTATDNGSNQRQGDAESITAERTSRMASIAEGNMKLIPWADIWTSLRIARIRDNGEIIEVFYETLFKEAIFDDNGAWSMHVRT